MDQPNYSEINVLLQAFPKRTGETVSQVVQSLVTQLASQDLEIAKLKAETNALKEQIASQENEQADTVESFPAS
jgi:cell division protein FtsB